MENLLQNLQTMLNFNEIDYNTLCHEFASNRYRPLLTDILIERKDILRGKLDLVMHQDSDETSNEIESILTQLEQPTFPLVDSNNEKDEEWTCLEKKYCDEIQELKNNLNTKTIQLLEDQQIALTKIQDVLNAQMKYRPIDQRDLSNARDSINRRFKQINSTLRGECATKVLVLRREIEQQGRKRRNFDKQTTDILQKWFNNHLQKPYPTDDEKTELAKICGIKVSQVNNWFGNQRIRTKQQMKSKTEETNVNAQLNHLPEHIPVQHNSNYSNDYLPQHAHSDIFLNQRSIDHAHQSEVQNQQMFYNQFGCSTENDVFQSNSMNF